MSVQLAQLVTFKPMEIADVDAIMAIEPTIYSHPWSKGNFTDSLKMGYPAYMMMQDNVLVGYALMMMILDEAHLLNISIAKPYQRKGLGRVLLAEMMTIAQQKQALNMFLEVRVSNLAAIKLYESMGFNEMSIRRQYYPTEDGREDAVLMGLAL